MWWCSNASIELAEFRTLQKEISALTKKHVDPEIWLPPEVSLLLNLLPNELVYPPDASTSLLVQVAAQVLNALQIPSTEVISLLETPNGVPTRRFVTSVAQMARGQIDRFRRLESSCGFFVVDH